MNRPVDRSFPAFGFHDERGDIFWIEVPMTNSLFDEIGGSEVVDSVVENFYQKVVNDEQLGKFFKNASVDRIKSMQRQLFGVALGAPLEYEGKPLNEVHKGLGITRDDLSIYIEHLMDTLTEMGIAGENANRFVARIATYADEVLGESTVDG